MVLPEKEILQAVERLSKNARAPILFALESEDFNGAISGVPIRETRILVELAAAFSRPRISDYRVGAVAIGQSGRAYLGANIEFQGPPLNATLHAEQSAILNAWMQGEPALSHLFVSALPCGHCRQFIKELSCADDMQIGVGNELFSIQELLPHPFDPPKKKGTGLLDSPQTRLASRTLHANESSRRAIEAAQRSYTPASCSPEGSSIDCSDGRSYFGSAAESAAFNPSVSSILTALNQLNLSASRHVAINACTLAKLATATVDPLPMAKAILSSISGARIDVALMEPAS